MLVYRDFFGVNRGSSCGVQRSEAGGHPWRGICRAEIARLGFPHYDTYEVLVVAYRIYNINN